MTQEKVELESLSEIAKIKQLVSQINAKVQRPKESVLSMNFTLRQLLTTAGYFAAFAVCALMLFGIYFPSDLTSFPFG